MRMRITQKEAELRDESEKESQQHLWTPETSPTYSPSSPVFLQMSQYASPSQPQFNFVVVITADGDCSHEIKRRLLLGRKVMTNLDSTLKSRDITLPTKYSQGYGFSSGCV